ncbi:MAG: hypothetical protein ABJO09_14930 [Hyphomicrobiales bacterium]
MFIFSPGLLLWYLFFVAVSLFYTVGSIALVRAISVDTLLDDAIAQIDPDSNNQQLNAQEASDRKVLTVISVIMFAGGAFLAVQSALAPLIFCLCLSVQLLQIFVLKSHSAAGDDPAAGRATTVNATIIYSVVTLCLVLAQLFSLLPPFPLEWSWREVTGALLSIYFVSYAVFQFKFVGTDQDQTPTDIKLSAESGLEDEGSLLDIDKVLEVLVQAEEFNWGIWCHNGETWQATDPAGLGVSPELVRRIGVWEDSYDEHWDLNDPGHEPQLDADAETLHFQEAREIAKALKEEFVTCGLSHIKVSWADQQLNTNQI